jgi:hypothetical protein
MVRRELTRSIWTAAGHPARPGRQSFAPIRQHPTRGVGIVTDLGRQCHRIFSGALDEARSGTFAVVVSDSVHLKPGNNIGGQLDCALGHERGRRTNRRGFIKATSVALLSTARFGSPVRRSMSAESGAYRACRPDQSVTLPAVANLAGRH